MNKTLIEFILSVVFFGLGVFLLFSVIKTENNSIKYTETRQGNYLNNVEANNNNFEKDGINAVFEITDRTCSPCLTNVEEYIDILNERGINIYLVKIFTNKPENAERIIKIKNWEDYNHQAIKGIELDRNRLIVFKPNKDFYSSSIISNGVVTSLEKKNKIINEHLNFKKEN